jgi:hypothetical protein
MIQNEGLFGLKEIFEVCLGNVTFECRECCNNATCSKLANYY